MIFCRAKEATANVRATGIHDSERVAEEGTLAGGKLNDIPTVSEAHM